MMAAEDDRRGVQILEERFDDTNERPASPAVTADQLCAVLGRLGILLVEILTSSLDEIETKGALVLCLLHQATNG